MGGVRVSDVGFRASDFGFRGLGMFRVRVLGF